MRTARTLDELRTQYERIIEDASLLQQVALADLTRRPAPNRWSANECVTHLNLSADPYFPLWREGIAEAAAAGPRDGTFRLDFWGRMLVWTLEPPPRFRFSTTPPFTPRVGTSDASAVPPFLERQRRILDVIESARGRAIDRPRITSPFSRRVRYTIWSSLCVTASHERRHLWQARQALG